MSMEAMLAAMNDPRLGPSEKLLMIVLGNYADEHLRCYPAQKTIAEKTGLTDRTIRTILKNLQDREMLTRVERKRPDGSRSSDLITLVCLQERAEEFSRRMRGEFPGDAEKSSGQEPIKGNSIGSEDPKIVGLRAIEKSFEDWWAKYPRKVGKDVAVKAYAKAYVKVRKERPDEDAAAVLLAGLERSKATRQWQRGAEHQPHATTWLNRSGWKDEDDDGTADQGSFFGRDRPGPGTGPAGRPSERDESVGRMLRGAMAALDRSRDGTGESGER